MSEQRRLAAILVADVVGYSKLIGNDEAGTLAQLQALRTEVIEPQIAKHAGRLFKSVGDGFLIEFASAVQAVACAKAIQEANAGGSLPLRIGIHVGDVVVEGEDLAGEHQLEAARGAAKVQGLAVTVLPTNPPQGYEAAFAQIGVQAGSGVVQFGSAGFIADAPQLAAAALKHRLPTISNLQVYAQAGLLMTYGPDSDTYFGRAVAIADRIAKGARPGELPIELPTRFELVVNLKTARGLRLTIPPSLLARADEVIE